MFRAILILTLACWYALLDQLHYLTVPGKNAAVVGVSGVAKWVGLLKTLHEEALTSETTSGTKLKMTGSEGKGYTNEKVVVFSEVNGNTTKGEKVAGIWIGQVYFVVGAATNEFEVSQERGGTAVTVGAAVKTTTKVVLLEEISGGSYKREKITWKTAAGGNQEAETNNKIPVPASTEVTYMAIWEKAKQSEETHANEVMQALETLEHPEKFTGAGEYEFTKDELQSWF